MIEESYVSLDTAKMLKEAGFDEVCSLSYCSDKGDKSFLLERNSDLTPGQCSCPTQSLAARWLHEVHGLFIEMFYRISGLNYEIIHIKTNTVAFSPNSPKLNFTSYEACLEDALQEAIKLIKK